MLVSLRKDLNPESCRDPPSLASQPLACEGLARETRTPRALKRHAPINTHHYSTACSWDPGSISPLTYNNTLCYNICCKEILQKSRCRLTLQHFIHKKTCHVAWTRPLIYRTCVRGVSILVFGGRPPKNKFLVQITL